MDVESSTTIPALAQWLVAVFTLVGFPMTVIALIYTIRQTTRARTSSEAAKQAAEDTASHIFAVRLQSLVHDLERLSDWLEAACSSDNHQWARAVLGSWQGATAHLIGALRQTNADVSRLRTPVRDSREEAIAATNALHDTNRPVLQSVAAFQAHMARVVVASTELAAEPSTRQGALQVGRF